MLIQIRTLAALHYNRAPKTWAYGYFYNSKNGLSISRCTICIRYVPKKAMSLRDPSFPRSENYFNKKQQ